MKKIIALLAICLTLFVSAQAISGTGPAPNSGDGVPDGSGMAGRNGSNNDNDGSRGPAPNSGDGVPDGSGF